MTTTDTSDLDHGQSSIDGVPAAGLVAVGIGAVVLGFFVTLAEASTGTKDWLQWNDRVGPLSGKTILAVLAYFVAFAVLGAWWRNRTFALRAVMLAAALLVLLGLLFTFPPIFQAFEAD